MTPVDVVALVAAYNVIEISTPAVTVTEKIISEQRTKIEEISRGSLPTPISRKRLYGFGCNSAAV